MPWPDQAGGGREARQAPDRRRRARFRRRARAEPVVPRLPQIRVTTRPAARPRRAPARRVLRHIDRRRTHRARQRAGGCQGARRRRTTPCGRRGKTPQQKEGIEQPSAEARKPAARPRKTVIARRGSQAQAEAEAKSVSAKPGQDRGGDRANSACRTRARRCRRWQRTRMKVRARSARPGGVDRPRHLQRPRQTCAGKQPRPADAGHSLNAMNVRERSIASFRAAPSASRDTPRTSRGKAIREVTIPGSHHHPGARHRMAERRRGRDPAADEAGPDGEITDVDRRRYRELVAEEMG